MLPLDDLALLQVYQPVVHLPARCDDNDICNPDWQRGTVGLLEPGLHLGLARLMERDNVEVDIAVGFLDCCYGCLDLGEGQGIKGMRNFGFWNGTHLGHGA
jgi:hypothetical protein